MNRTHVSGETIAALRIPKRKGEAFIQFLRDMNLLDRNTVVQRVGEELLVPLTRPLSEAERSMLHQQLGGFAEERAMFEMRPKARSLIDYLDEQIPASLRTFTPRSVDVIGHVAVVEVPRELAPYGQPLGEGIMRWKRRVRAVLAKAGPIGGQHRTREFKLLAGEDSTEAIHREHGCRFLVDVRKVHFNPRLAFEHNRIARLTAEGETVWDMFSGIGCFAVLIAKTHPTVTVYASDVNPDAYAYLQRNIELNKVQGRVIPLHRDAALAASNELRGRMDRIIMDLPSNALDFLPTACQALKAEGGVIHVYSFTTEKPPFTNTRELVERRLKSGGWSAVNVTAARKVRSSAPHEWMVAIDARVGDSPFH